MTRANIRERVAAVTVIVAAALFAVPSLAVAWTGYVDNGGGLVIQREADDTSTAYNDNVVTVYWSDRAPTNSEYANGSWHTNPFMNVITDVKMNECDQAVVVVPDMRAEFFLLTNPPESWHVMVSGAKRVKAFQESSESTVAISNWSSMPSDSSSGPVSIEGTLPVSVASFGTLEGNAIDAFIVVGLLGAGIATWSRLGGRRG